ncbi:MAG: aminotransferase class IV [Planctomycetes bacterium]|nr:aminotransferase class IV [Planctomycetota bacterium]
MPATLANLHGHIMPLEDVRISAQDRGFLFGDSVYEVLRVYGGRPWLEEEHWQRLKHSLDAIRIEGVDLERLRRRMHETLAAGPFDEAMVYLQVTRGAAPRRHAFPKDTVPLELLWVQDYDDGPTAKGRTTGVAVITRPDIRWGRCDIKSTNLLANVLVNQEAAEAGAAEAILYLPDGTLSEASHSSFFTVKAGALQTTPLKANILPGITRKFLISLAQKAGILVREATLKREELFHVDELFLAGTTSEVLPVVAVDGRPIADGKPGPISKRLLEGHQRAVVEILHAK